MSRLNEYLEAVSKNEVDVLNILLNKFKKIKYDAIIEDNALKVTNINE